MNDYMFRVVLQENKFVLRGLIGSLLHLDQGEIRSVEIKNPIKLGEQIDDKTFVLDIEILLNNDTCLNLEMQVLNEGDWVDRSLSYLCRAYDDLQQGEDYSEAKCAIHIGILDFTLFKDVPEFYACYKQVPFISSITDAGGFSCNDVDLPR
ncbi:MAG: Rpn family recombination-promoting nuclease/putative transposase [Lachnospiraceae bacterium]